MKVKFSEVTGKPYCDELNRDLVDLLNEAARALSPNDPDKFHVLEAILNMSPEAWEALIRAGNEARALLQAQNEWGQQQNPLALDKI